MYADWEMYTVVHAGIRASVWIIVIYGQGLCLEHILTVCEVCSSSGQTANHHLCGGDLIKIRSGHLSLHRYKHTHLIITSSPSMTAQQYACQGGVGWRGSVHLRCT